MAQTYDVTDECPVCGEVMTVARLACGHCGSALEGSFRLVSAHAAPGISTSWSGPLGVPGQSDEARFGRLARLDQAQLEFVETFLRCRGTIKNVEDMLGISYPTVKARMASVLETMGFGADEDVPAAARRRVQRRKILADLAEGRITTDDAHKLLLDLQAVPESVEDTPETDDQSDQDDDED